MGYSIYINARNKQEQENIYNDIITLPRNDESGFSPVMGKDLSYRNEEDEFVVGFDYSSWISSEERHLIWSELKRMGEKYKYEFINYDGCENIPINEIK